MFQQNLKKFVHEQSIRQTVSVYYPQANGQVEGFNQVPKHLIQLARLCNKDVQIAILEYLTTYRSTPDATTGVILRNRTLWTRLDAVGLEGHSININTPKVC